MAHLDVPAVRSRALKVVVDLMMWHGLAAFIADNAADVDDDARSDDGMSSISQSTNRVSQCLLFVQEEFVSMHVSLTFIILFVDSQSDFRFFLFLFKIRFSFNSVSFQTLIFLFSSR